MMIHQTAMMKKCLTLNKETSCAFGKGGGRMGGKNISKHSATVIDTQVVNTVTEYFQSALFVYHQWRLSGLEIMIVQDILQSFPATELLCKIILTTVHVFVE